MNTGLMCPACGHIGLSDVALVERLPVHVGVLWKSREAAAACPTGDMHIRFCEGCGLLTNTAFDPGKLDYTLEYDNSLHASPVFREFESGLVESLVDRHDLHGKALVEIGGGSGRFLELLCEAGGNTGLGFDPSIGEDRVSSDGSMRLLAEYFTSSTNLGHTDFLCCRQVLEHIPDLSGFLGPVATVLRETPGVVAYFDVPNSTMLLDDLSVWDLVYEHCHYFVAESLRAALESAGLGVAESWTSFGDQFLSVEVTGATDENASEPPGRTRASETLTRSVHAFAGHLQQRRREWTDRLGAEREAGRRVAVWGAGARAVSFVSMVGASDELAYLVDANENKQGTYLSGTGHAIHAPERLAEDPVDMVVLLNGIYREEIGRELAILNPETTLVVA